MRGHIPKQRFCVQSGPIGFDLLSPQQQAELETPAAVSDYAERTNDGHDEQKLATDWGRELRQLEIGCYTFVTYGCIPQNKKRRDP